MKKINIIFPLMAATLAFTSCDDVFEPAIENHRDINAMWNEPAYAQGILANAYILLPYDAASVNDVATDDAVSNDVVNNYMKMATGAWAPENNPMEQWRNRYNAIQYTNIMLENYQKVKWARQDQVALNTMFADHFMAEAHALRALQYVYLLRAHAGKVNGQMMGVPLVMKYQDRNANFNLERNTFSDCVDSILLDLDIALKYLPEQYVDIPNEDAVPERYKAMGGTMADYNRAFGAHHEGKIDARIVKAIRAQFALMCASPAFEGSSVLDWNKAAEYAAEVVKIAGGVSGLDDHGWDNFAQNSMLNDLAAHKNPKDLLWRGGMSESNDWEKDNYPPSLYGKGRINPTQNLVDAFPMANGYPITDSRSGYDPNDPYTGRDPRLAADILINGQKMGATSGEIITRFDGTNKDALDKEGGISTRTGYYLRKHLRNDINLSSSSETKKKHLSPRIRFTELYLDYAEAMNEAQGPDANPYGVGSAKAIIKAIRERCGICKNTADPYLDECAASKEKMRELIRNERRLELCFENQRFYDLRRWNVSLDELNAPAMGMKITKDASGVVKYEKIEVEKRAYKDYQIYGPIPYGETVKWSNLKQNDGWDSKKAE